MVAIGESVGYLPEQRPPRPPALFSRGGKLVGFAPLDWAPQNTDPADAAVS